ncbi:MAG TPA: hypothetical protein VG735_07975 [Caulobacterales bacterium]|nr:hypothetical protein [Caulobacterales bacterium]
MAKPRTPADVAEITGATVVNPGRHENRARPKVAKVGAPYARMPDAQKEYWAVFVGEYPWLAASDRMQLRLLCRLCADMDERDAKGLDFPAARENMIRQILNSFGGSPSDRTRVGVSLAGLRTLENEPEAVGDDDEPRDPASEFIN